MRLWELVLTTVMGWLGFASPDEAEDEGDYLAGTRQVLDIKGPERNGQVKADACPPDYELCA